MIGIVNKIIKCNICGKKAVVLDIIRLSELGIHVVSEWVTPCCETFDYDGAPETPEIIKSYIPFEPTGEYRRRHD